LLELRDGGAENNNNVRVRHDGSATDESAGTERAICEPEVHAPFGVASEGD
jgi:hypothetical protein